jgi:serine protease Do
VVGVDPETDLALLQVDGIDLVPARLAAGDGLRIGKSVAALAAGPAPDRWVSAGVISGLHRIAPLTSGIQGTGLIETDAQFDGTAAGGALLDHTGAVVAVLTGPGRYAVPIDVARDVAAQLEVNRAAAHGWTGVVGTDVLDRPGGGVRIRGIVDGSPAQAGGLQVDDVVLGIADVDVGNIGELVASVRKLKPGDPVEVTVMRGSQRKVIDITLGTSIPTPSDWLVVA